MELSPRAHIKAQSKAAKIITMLVSKLASFVKLARPLLPFACGALVGESRSRRCGRW
ncbi:hypothetical protein SLEP1_g5154 [Rubroshorea leprosula]|uniref:Uncharacterized protein n=1 Tax=Rubroshorea leprosula TaxID=152421 RepID=A0AAV5I1M0_9ROSI|nr:hypothetical protein SLEP1_g5154 [Rubroshorea leprosula]